jgi:CRISPR-associated protein (TIGR02710 family)
MERKGMVKQADTDGATPVERSVLVCSVGGSPEPVCTSIDRQKPEYVMFVASPESRKTIRKDIEAALTWDGIIDSHTITLADYQDLLACVRDIRAGIEKGLRDMDLPEDTLLVADITGGTKIMSAALTLVMMEHRSRFAYVGGHRRTKAGLGVVETGHENFMRQDNPWDVMALREVRALARSFNAGEFVAAWKTAKELAANTTAAEKFYAPVRELVYAYCLWDGFEHTNALRKLTEAIGRLEPFAMNNAQWRNQLDLFKKSKTTLENVQRDAEELRSSKGTLSSNRGTAYLCDLLANAHRRMRAGRHDDAVARLYSSIEKNAKIALLARHGIDNSNVDLARVPEGQCESLRAAQGEDGRIRIGLQKSFHLLDALRDPLGQLYRHREKELRCSLEARNMSLLAHGYNPVKEEACKQLFCIALEFLGMREEDLPGYPTLDWKSLVV